MNIKCIFSILLLSASVPLSAAVINFDDAWATLGNGGNPATFYNGAGVTISGAYFGTVGGVGNGDPGGWSLEGTNGSAFLGCNDGDSCSPTFTFSSPTTLSVDIGLSFGTTSTFTVTGKLGGVFVDSKTFTVSDPGADNGTWHTFTLNGAIDQAVISSVNAEAYGVDNLNFAPAVAGTPEPATLSMFLGAAGLGIIGAMRRRARK